MARELGGREAIAAALKNLPEGFSVAANEIKAPPYIFQAYKDPVAVTLTLTGYVPDNNVHAAIVAAAGRKFFSEKVVDNLKASVGAPADSPTRWCRRSARCRGCRPARWWYPTARSNSRATRSMTRRRPDPRRARQGFSAGLAVQSRIFRSSRRRRRSMRRSASNCLRICWPRRRIRFESGRPTIDPDFAGLLDRLVETALRCPNANIEIAGHTDGDGEDAFNQALSEKRAQAVMDYLVKAGLPANRFTPIGYGSTQPVAANDTDEGKAQNRRIDFVVRQ